MEEIAQKRINIKGYKIKDFQSLKEIEDKFRKEDISTEYMPWAKGASYKEIAENIIKDKKGYWKAPLYFIQSYHGTELGIKNICAKANEYIEILKTHTPLDILSISACLEGGRLVLKILARSYAGPFNFTGFFDYIGESIEEDIKVENEATSGSLVIPDEIKQFSYTEEEIIKHDEKYKEQIAVYQNSNIEKPFLNCIDQYIPKKLPSPEDKIDLIYDLETNDKKLKIVGDYDSFISIFREIMSYVNGVEYYHYINVMNGDESEETFMNFLEDYTKQTYVKKSNKLCEEDVPAMMSKLYRSLFQLYIVQDLIDDPKVTDVKITAPDSIRARIEGKAYISNITFIDENDYLRFVNGIAVRNHISQNVPSQTFTDKHDKNYILRFSITAQYVNSVEWPYLHIRKVDRNKLMSDDLIKAGMMDEKIKDYLIDCGKNSRGVVFAGPPGSGKTVMLNWFLEDAYEQSAEILVIQENDELFCYRKGVMFQHVVNYPSKNEKPVTLEQLGSLALVAGANVFIIGEAKGAEICSAITLSNSGCRTAITIHSPSSTETIDKMADLAMRGHAENYEQAKRMLKSFQTIVYLEDFKVKEISEITGYNEEKHDMEYNYIYRRNTETTQ